jgi:hypothetical protein
MINFRLYLAKEKNDSSFYQNLHVTMRLPVVPDLNSYVMLGEDLTNELREKIICDDEALFFYKHFFYNKSSFIKEFDYMSDVNVNLKEYLNDFNLSDMAYVVDVVYQANKDYVILVMGDWQLASRI